jgi:SAM-dependent methyltransferase
LLRHAGLSVSSGDVFDYGFGAGTFFHYCARDCRLVGVEVDPRAVEQVRRMLEGSGRFCDLQVIDPDAWARHPFLRREYDLIICSHVLEHLDAPVELVSALGRCLKPHGAILAIVPINELRYNPQHIQVVSRAVVEDWTAQSGLRLLLY